MSMTVRRVIPVIAGPTAAGKTAMAIEIAACIGAEILSSDSRQIYRGLDIGTAKPTAEERKRVPHHLIDELDIQETYSAGIFARMAEDRIGDIQSRGRIPLVTGGSTLYLQALLKGLADIPNVAQSIREQLNERLRTEGSGVLFNELVDVDPVFAASLDPTKTQRIVRGLEVYYETRRPLSSYFSTGNPPSHSYELFVLTRGRAHLYERIEQRVERMISLGLVAEVRHLLNEHGDRSLDALRTIGYREIVEHLNGETTLQEAVAKIKLNTRRYAKRQLTWFRKYEGAFWFDLDERDEADVREELISKIRAS